MGPDPVHMMGSVVPEEHVEEVRKRLERIGSVIMNRATGPSMLNDNPLGSVLADPQKRSAAAQIIGQAYVTAYATMVANKEAIEQIADALVEEKEIYGDDVTRLLTGVGLRRPTLDVTDPATWPTV
jgi:hypothetical protein